MIVNPRLHGFLRYLENKFHDMFYFYMKNSVLNLLRRHGNHRSATMFRVGSIKVCKTLYKMLNNKHIFLYRNFFKTIIVTAEIWVRQILHTHTFTEIPLKWLLYQQKYELGKFHTHTHTHTHMCIQTLKIATRNFVNCLRPYLLSKEHAKSWVNQ